MLTALLLMQFGWCFVTHHPPPLPSLPCPTPPCGHKSLASRVFASGSTTLLLLSLMFLAGVHSLLPPPVTIPIPIPTPAPAYCRPRYPPTATTAYYHPPPMTTYCPLPPPAYYYHRL